MMDKVEKFQIVFNNPTATYIAGETVYGYGWIVVKEALYVQSELGGGGGEEGLFVCLLKA